MEQLLKEYLPILIFLCIAVGMAVAMVVASFLIASQKPDSEKVSAYECGFEAFDDARGRFDVLQIDQFFFASYISTLKFSGWCYRQIYTIEETLNNFHQYSKSEKVYLHQDFGQLFNTFFMIEDETIGYQNKENQCFFIILAPQGQV